MFIKRAQKLGHWLTKSTENIGAIIMLGLVVANFLQVFFRYVVNAPLGWTEEAMRYALVWLVFLVSCAALWRGEHMTIDILREILPQRFYQVVRVVNLLCVVLFCFILVWWGGPLALHVASEVSPSAGIPMIVPMSAVVVGGALMLIAAVILIVTISRGSESDSSGEGGSQ